MIYSESEEHTHMLTKVCTHTVTHTHTHTHTHTNDKGEDNLIEGGAD